jgi:hypothetical protein
MAYAAGQLAPDTMGSVREHVSQCSTCSRRISWSIRDATVPESNVVPSSRKRLGRYALLRMLGSGGMGSVYEAHDDELERRVALKLLRERWSDETTWSRLRREAKAMAKLAHPNVVRVYDLGVAEEQPYLTMELVDGVTLTTWLRERRRGWRSILEAFIAAGRGLAAAHAVGIVHRDFKPDNVLVAKNGRVCVTDFGIAVVELDESARDMRGTPAYMAPEQMSRAPFDARADVFGFCVALYEALYGVRPFTGTNLLELREAIARQRLNAPVRRGAPGWVRDALRRGLRADPGERYPTIDALLAGIDPTPRTRRWRRGLAAVGTVAALCAAVGMWRAEARSAAAKALLVPSGPTRVAVVVVDHAPAGRDGAAEAVAPIVAAGLGAVDRVVIADPELVGRSMQGTRDAVDSARIAAAAGAGRVVVVDLDAGAVRASIMDSVPGTAPLWRTSKRVEGGDWVEAARDLAVDVAGELGAQKDAARAAAEAAAPRDREVALVMGRALRAKLGHDAHGAALLFEEACRKDTSGPAACAERAALLEGLGDQAPAAEAARLALERSAKAPADVRAGIGALLRSASGEYEQAVASYRALWSARPDDRARALLLARAQQRTGSRKDAQATIDAVRARGVPVGEDPEVDAAEERIRTTMGDNEGAVAIARAMVARADSIGDVWLASRARYLEGHALIMSRPQDAEALEAAARQGFLSIGDRRDAAWTEIPRAWALAGSNPGKARAILEEVEAEAPALGDISLERTTLGTLGFVYQRDDELELATKALARATRLYRGAGDDAGLASTTNSLCVAIALRGDLLAENAACDEALTLFRRVGDRLGTMIILTNMAVSDYYRGALDVADARAREALTIALELGSGVEWPRYTLAFILEGEGRVAEAESADRAATAEAVASADEATEAVIRGFLARLLARQAGRAADARDAIQQAESAIARTTERDANRRARLDVAIARLALARTQADRDAVAKAASDVDAEATRAERLALAIQARLVRAEARRSRTDLQAVEVQAHALGLELFAREAHAAAEGVGGQR